MQISTIFPFFTAAEKAANNSKTFSLNSLCINFISQFAKVSVEWRKLGVGNSASCITSYRQLFVNSDQAVVVIKSLVHVVFVNFSGTLRCFSRQQNAKVPLTRLKQILFSSPRCLLRHKEKNSSCNV